MRQKCVKGKAPTRFCDIRHSAVAWEQAHREAQLLKCASRPDPPMLMVDHRSLPHRASCLAARRKESSASCSPRTVHLPREHRIRGVGCETRVQLGARIHRSCRQSLVESIDPGREPALLRRNRGERHLAGLASRLVVRMPRRQQPWRTASFQWHLAESCSPCQ